MNTRIIVRRCIERQGDICCDHMVIANEWKPCHTKSQLAGVTVVRLTKRWVCSTTRRLCRSESHSAWVWEICPWVVFFGFEGFQARSVGTGKGRGSPVAVTLEVSRDLPSRTRRCSTDTLSPTLLFITRELPSSITYI